MLFCSAGTLTLFACQWLKRCILNSAELKERSQHMFFFFFFYFNQHPLPYLLVSALNFLWVCVSFFMASLDSTASAVLNLFLWVFFTLKSEEEFNRELYSNVYLLFNLYLQLYLLGFCQADSTIFILYLVVTQTKFHCGQKFC